MMSVKEEAKQSFFSPHNEVYVQYLKSTEKHNMQVQHYHNSYEIYVQLAGKRYIFYDNVCHTLERGDVLVCAPLELHYAQSRDSDYYERYVVNFSTVDLDGVFDKSVSKLLFHKLSGGVYHFEEEKIHTLCSLFQRLDEFANWKCILKKPLMASAILPILLFFSENIDAYTEGQEKNIPISVASGIQYIQKHYQGEVTLDDVARAAGSSKYYFCRIFKETTGATVLEYLNHIRLIKVHSLLLDTGESVEKIAIKTGFSSGAHLSRIFKQVYGISPRTFRKTEHEK